MSTLKRIRNVSFRVSDEEYTQVMALYPASGARNVSEFARYAIERLLDASRHEQRTALRSVELGGRVSSLEREVRRLSEILTSGEVAR